MQQSQVPVGLHWDVEALTAAAAKDGRRPMPSRFGGWLSGAELFDAQMFGLQVSGVQSVVCRCYVFSSNAFVFPP